MIKEQLIEVIVPALLQRYPTLTFTDIQLMFQMPKDKKNGDLTTNIAMRLTKKTGVTAQVIAQTIVDAVVATDLVEQAVIAGPGFVNFFLTTTDIFQKLDTMIQEGVAYGQQAPKTESVNIEYVSVNPTGDLHIGHARGAVYGDVIANLLEKAGYQVTREYYINDAGNQITKLGASTEVRYEQLLGNDIPMIEDGYHGADIIEIAQELVNTHQTTINQLAPEDRLSFFSEYALKAELVKIKADLANIRIHHDVWFSERTLYRDGVIQKTVSELEKRDMLYEQDGAIWLKSSLYGDDKDRVLVKSDGSYTYLTPDIGYHVNKIARLTGEQKQLIDVLGGDHHGYVARMRAALQALGYPSDILKVRLIQMVRFIQNGVEVKMSKRTGNSITMRELIEEVGVDATRYYFSMRSCDTPLDFDMTLATESSSNNPVYYAQYAHARICSILRKATETIDMEGIKFDNNYELLTAEKERELANKLNQYTEIIQMAANRLEPFKITNYIQELAACFHAFYNAVKVIDSTNVELSTQRLKLLMATRVVLQSAFAIIGISAPEHM